MAIRLNAPTERLTTAVNAPSGDFTVSFWVYPATTPVDWRLVWGIGGDTAFGNDSHTLWLDNFLQLHIKSPPSFDTITGPVISAPAWHHIAVVGNTGASQAWSLWVDGTEYTGTSGSGTYTNGPVDFMGSTDYNDIQLDGRATAYKHWSVKLTADQVQSERWCYLPRYGTSLYCVAPLFHIDYLSDYSGNGNDFTASGTLTTEDGPPIVLGTGFSQGAGQTLTGGSGFLFGSGAFKPVWRGRRR